MGQRSIAYFPMVGVTLLHRKGYFYQRLDGTGWQNEEPVEWVVEDYLEEMPQRVAVPIEGRPVHLRAWSCELKGVTGFRVPVFFLDADLPENADWDKSLTHYLYGGDAHYRLCQEALLGIGGVRMLRALGYEDMDRFHIDSITNGVHAATWTAPPFQQLYDRYIPGWREDNFSLRYALAIPAQEVWGRTRTRSESCSST